MDQNENLDRIATNMDKLAALVSETSRLLHEVVQAELWDDVEAAWIALEESDDPADVALMRRIRERTRAKDRPASRQV